MARARLHRCFAPGCTKDIPATKLLCLHHWKKTPEDLRNRLCEAWKYGISRKCHPTQEYLAVRDEIHAHLRRQGEKALAKRDAKNVPLALNSA